MAKQGHTLKKFKDSEQLFEEVDLSKLTVDFEKKPAQVHQQSSCIGKVNTIVTFFKKNNFRLIKSICRENFIYKYFTYKFKRKD